MNQTSENDATTQTNTNPNNKAADSTTAAPANGQTPRVITDPNEVAQLVMMRIDHVNAKKDELTISIKALADTAKQLVSVYGNQQAQIAKLAKQVDVLEKLNAKT